MTGRARAAALALYGLSGALALGYQVLWSRYLLDFIGVGSYSDATVLAAFMAGLALGSALLGRAADRAARPLLLMAALEAAIGAYAFVYPTLRSGVADLYGRLATASPEALLSGGGAWPKALAAGLLLLPPAMLMGGTYPALLRHLTPTAAAAGARAAQVYAIGALGAAAGALGVALVALPALGMSGSLTLLGGTSLALAAAAALLARAVPPASAAPPSRPAEEPVASGIRAPDPAAPAASGLVLAALFAAGFVAFALEIAFTRFLGLSFGPSADSFAVMLAGFVAGIGLGSAWLARRRVERPLAWFGWSQLLLALALLLPLPLYPELPRLALALLPLFPPGAAGYAFFTAARLVVGLALLLPVTLLIGMSLPLAIQARTRSVGELGRVSGRCSAWNTAGDVAGALATGAWLLPWLGMEGLFRAGALGATLVGFGLLWGEAGRAAGGRGLARPRMALALVAALHLALPRWTPAKFTLQPFRRPAAEASEAELERRLASTRVLLFRDDPAAHLIVSEQPGADGRLERSLLVGGKADGSSRGDLPTQLLLAHLPLLLAPRAREVLVVGLATGSTASAVLAHPVERLDVVELVRAMPEAARLFRDLGPDPLADPRTRLMIADARDVVAYGSGRYDVIVSEPSNPWMAGVAGLYGAEFYARAARRLRDGGVFAQWLHSYELDDETFAIALGTLHDAFPEVSVFQLGPRDLLLLGSRAPLRPDWAASLARLAEAPVARQLAPLGIRNLGSLLALQQLSPASCDAIALRFTARNTDDNRLLELRAPRRLFDGSRVRIVERLDERLGGSAALLWSDFAGRHPERLRPAETERMFAGPALRDEVMRRVWAEALDHLDPARGASPDRPRERLAQRLGSGSGPEVERALAERASGLLLAAALSEDQARFWIDVTEGWAEGRDEIRARFRVELLLAARERDRARAELGAWLARAPAGDDWAELRACALDAALCARARGGPAGGR